MNTPAQFTDAHYALAHEVMMTYEDANYDCAAQLIADSEAKAKEAEFVVAIHERVGRMKAEAERDRLRAEVERLNEAMRSVPRLIGDQNGRLARERHEAIARAERAETELANERARVIELAREVEYLRSWGNKDCTAMADAAMKESAP